MVMARPAVGLAQAELPDVRLQLGTPKASARALCAALCTWVLSKVESVAWQGASVKKGRHLPRKILR